MARLIYFRKKDQGDSLSPFEHDPVKMISGECELVTFGNHTIERYPVDNLSGFIELLNHLISNDAFPLNNQMVFGLHTQRSFRQLMDWASRFLSPENVMYPQQLLARSADLVECLYCASTISLSERLGFTADTVAHVLNFDNTHPDPVYREVGYLRELAEYYE